MSLNEEISETKKFLIRAKGKNILSEEFSSGFLSQNENNEQIEDQGYFDFTYKINAKDNSIFAIYGEMGVKSSVSDRKITFECYELLKTQKS